MADNTPSLADWNNNPGNLRPPKGVTYEGQIGVDDRGFAIFENKTFGRSALVGDIKAKVGKGLNTPEAFLNRYAPAGDNDEEARDNYKIHLADALGLNSTGAVFPEDSYEKIADAIAAFEGKGSVAAQAPPTNEPNPRVTLGDPPPPRTGGITPGAAELGPEALSLYGGGAGLTVGTGGIAAQKSAGLIKNLYERAFPGEAYASRVEPTLGGSSTARPPANIPTPVAQSVVSGTPVAQGVSTGEISKAPGHERWLEPRSAAPIPKAFSNEMTTMTGGANVPGSGENILARNAAAVQKVRELGYNPLTMGKYGDILLTEPSKVRPKAPDVWTRSRAVGPAPFVARPAAPAPVVSPLPALPATTAPASALPVAAAAAPEESVLAHIFRKTKPVLAPITKIGLSGLSGALGANQLYEADKSRREQGLNLDNSLDYLSGAGGVHLWGGGGIKRGIPR